MRPILLRISALPLNRITETNAWIGIAEQLAELIFQLGIAAFAEGGRPDVPV
jgi:hypothetical protein